MPIRLIEAPMGEPLTIAKVVDSNLANRLRRMGLFENSEIVRLDREVLAQPVRVLGPRGEAVLGEGMAMKIVIHLDEGSRVPLAEVEPGQKGHIEGITGGRALARALEVLGLGLDDPIQVIRKLPPMEYVAITEHGNRVRLTEGMAAKLWGCMGERMLQLVSARTGQRFQVTEILGGGNVRRMMLSRNIEPGTVLVLEGVARAQSLQLDIRNPVVISSREGLRLYLKPRDCECIFVHQVLGPASQP